MPQPEPQSAWTKRHVEGLMGRGACACLQYCVVSYIFAPLSLAPLPPRALLGYRSGTVPARATGSMTGEGVEGHLVPVW